MRPFINPSRRLSTLEVHDRPREKLVSNGPDHLTDVELAALLLGSGSRRRGVLELAGAIIELLDREGFTVGLAQLRGIPGIGPAKAMTVVAALELARRRIKPRGTRIRCAADIYPLVRHLADRPQEIFIAISLNGAHEVIATRVVTIGLLDRTHVHPREVFADVLTDRAAAVVVAHNHPSHDLTPSAADLEATKRLMNAGELLGIRVLDHVIFSPEGFVSLGELGVLGK